jgi:hypothetical protein
VRDGDFRVEFNAVHAGRADGSSRRTTAR